MRWGSRAVLFASALLLPFGLAADGLQQNSGATTSSDAAKLKSPVAADAKSLVEGRQLFAKHCASCHGSEGKGDGKAGELLKPRPADLTDAAWKSGSTEGDIFTVVRDGVRQTGMKGFAGRMTTRELWSVVNYVRTLSSAHRKGRS